MKKLFITFLIAILSSCSTNDDKNKTFLLPLETQVGANTFGVTIKSKVYIPRDPTGVSVGPTPRGMIFWGTSSNEWNEIEIKDGASAVGFNMVIHFQNLQNLGIGEYVLKESNFQSRIDSTPYNHIYFKIWDSTIANYAYYGSVENEGVVNVTRFDGSLTQNWIFSGKFSGKFVRYDNPNDFITITDGRFDLNLNTLRNHPFP